MFGKVLDAIVNAFLKLLGLPTPVLMFLFFALLYSPVLILDPEKRGLAVVILGIVLVCIFIMAICDSGSAPKEKDWKPIPGARYRKYKHETSDPFPWEICPRCGAGNTDDIHELTKRELVIRRKCNYCGYEWVQKTVQRSWPKPR